MPLILLVIFSVFAVWMWKQHPQLVIFGGVLCGLATAWLIFTLREDQKNAEAFRLRCMKLISEKLESFDGSKSLRVDIGSVLGNSMALSSDARKIAYIEKPDADVQIIDCNDVNSVEITQSFYSEGTSSATGGGGGVSVGIGPVGVASGAGQMHTNSSEIRKCDRMALLLHVKNPMAPIIEFLLIEGSAGRIGWSTTDQYYLKMFRVAKEWESIINSQRSAAKMGPSVKPQAWSEQAIEASPESDGKDA